MRHIRSSVEESMNSMSAIALHHTETMTLDVSLDDISDIPKSLTRPHHFNCFAETLVGNRDQLLVLLRDITHEESFIQIAMEAPVVDSHVHIAQVTILQGTHVRNAMTNHLIHRRTARLGELVVVQWTGVTVVLYSSLVHDSIYLIGRHSDSDRIGGCVQAQSSQTTSHAHSFDLEEMGREDKRLIRLWKCLHSYLFIGQDLNRSIAPFGLLGCRSSLGMISIIRSRYRLRHCPLLRLRERA